MLHKPAESNSDQLPVDGLVGPFELRVLRTINHLREEAYGAEIRRTLSDLLGRDVAIGQVYVTVDRLERKGFVSSEFSDPKPIRGGRAKRVFHLEAPGVRALEIAAAAIHAAGALRKKESSYGNQKGGLSSA